jgi:hypothetical protein
MGFVDKFARLMKGEPLYQPGDIIPQDSQQGADGAPAADSAQAPMPSQPAVIPTLAIKRVSTTVNGNRMQVRGTFQNDTTVALQLQQMLLLGRTVNLGIIIMPNHAQQDVLLYDGELVSSSYDGNAALYYHMYQQQDAAYMANYQPITHVEGTQLEITDLNLQLPVHTV